MTRRFVPILCFFSLLFSMNTLFAQNTTLTISGEVITIAPDFEPFEYPIFIYSEDDGTFFEDVITDLDGNFSTTIELTTTEPYNLFVETIDFCSGEIITETVSSDAGEVFLSFSVCSEWEPWEPDDCVAWFSYGQLNPDNYLEITFEDYTEGEINSWAWDFGDGNTSTEQNPVHTYTNGGIYEVTLTITGEDDCESTYMEFLCVYGDPGGCGCDAEYDPVCVDLGIFGINSYSNACMALCAGFTEDDFVECEVPCDIFIDLWDPVCVETADGEILWFENPLYAECEGYLPDSYVDCQPIDCICTEEWDPVCVFIEDIGITITYPNACWAECDEYDEDDFVECNNDDCGCEAVFGPPVCVINDAGDIENFMNMCYAECAGYGFDDLVDCEGDCICTSEWDPVCVLDPDGNILTFPNSCWADCEGYGPDTYTECVDPCICDDVWDPVCVVLDDGTELTFGNACEAECEGFGPDQYQSCDGGDDCFNCIFEEWDPVCVETADGEIIEFPNACWAECEGFEEDSYVECEVVDCGCDYSYAPVCVELDDGTFLEFINACLAECEGYEADQFVNCWGGEDCFAIFDFIQEDPDNPNVVNFYDGSFAFTSNITSWEWDFGDGGTSTEQNPVHVFDDLGILEVSLTITTDDGCTSSITIAVCIYDDGGPINDCGCPENLDPVCVLDDLGNLLWFPNACFAACEGFDETSFTECDNDPFPEDCDCPDEGDPVCVQLGEDIQLLFDNACLAECYGFTEEMFVECEEGTPGDDDIFEALGLDFGTFQVIFTNGSANPEIGIIEDAGNDVITEGLAAYPNPVQDELTLDFVSPIASKYSVSIMSITGQLVDQSEQDMYEGFNQLKVNVSQIPAGIYMARLQSADHQFTVKFVKSR